ncbi:MAG: Hsp20/alpha crystallin family protein [Bacteroidales bacterium]
MVLIHSNFQPGFAHRHGKNPYFQQEEPMENCQCMPAANILKFNDHAEIHMFAPGRKKDHFTINLENDMLNVEAESVDPVNAEYIQQEFYRDKFSRNFQISDVINPEKIEASYEDGILKIMLPFIEESKPKKKDISIS